MSADNGIYIAKFPEGFRVAYGQGIEYLDYYPEGSVERRQVLRYYFGKSEIHATLDEAYVAANKLAERYSYLEYGVCDVGAYESFTAPPAAIQLDKAAVIRKLSGSLKCYDVVPGAVTISMLSDDEYRDGAPYYVYDNKTITHLEILKQNTGFIVYAHGAGAYGDAATDDSTKVIEFLISEAEGYNTMTYFTRSSTSGFPGGVDGHTEIIYGQEQPWLMENRMVALCKDAGLAEHIAALLRRNPFTPAVKRIE